jgi:choline-sulfatase
VFRALLRVVLALSGGAVAALLAAVLEARYVSASLAEADQAPVPFGAAALASAGLLAPLGLVVGAAVSAAALFFEPHAPRTPLGYLAPLRDGPPHVRVSAAAAAPLVVLAVFAWSIASAHLARALFGYASVQRVGLSMGLFAVGSLLASLAVASALLPVTRRLLSSAAAAAPAWVDPLVTGTAALALAAALFALGIATGDAGGSGGVAGLGILGVLARRELDLRPLLLFGVLMVGAYALPVAFARGPLSSGGRPRLRPLLAAGLGALAVIVGILATIRASHALGEEPAVADAVERFAPLGRVSLTALRRATDRDRDGHSSRFGGADCDDDDPRINPTAIDIPGNEIDEDCSGADTPLLAPSEERQDSASATVRPERTYNVILITIDTLRFDLGFAGYPKPVSPNIDALAAKSTVFERAYSLASYTAKSLGPMLIGKYPSETRRDYEHYTSFYGANTFVAERLKQAGARTLGGHCHYYFKWETGYRQGFDVWDTSAIPEGMGDNDTSITSDRMSDLAIKLLSQPENVTPTAGMEAAAGDAGADAAAGGDMADGGAERAAAAGSSPARFFAWFHYFDPHAQYVSHKEAPDFGAMKVEGVPAGRAIYDKEVWFTDKHIGRVIDHVMSQPWGKDTAIIITADHGEAFGERGYFRHGRELWEPAVRVPLVVYVPGAEPRRVAVKRSHIDLAPTIVDLVGAPRGDAAELRGESLLADVFAPEGAPHEERDVYLDMPEGPYNEVRRAIITGPTPGMKLVHFGGRRYELYDLAEDPNETKNLAGREKEKLEAAQARMQQMRARLTEIAVTAPR